MKVIFCGGGNKISPEKKKVAKNYIIKMLESFSVGYDEITTAGWTIQNMNKKVLAPHGTIKGMDYAVYSPEPIDPIPLGKLDPTSNYLVGRINGKDKHYYLINLGEFLYIAKNYTIYPPRIIHAQII